MNEIPQGYYFSETKVAKNKRGMLKHNIQNLKSIQN